MVTLITALNWLLVGLLVLVVVWAIWEIAISLGKANPEAPKPPNREETDV